MTNELKYGTEVENNYEKKDYARLIAAQNESEGRLKIISINNTLSEEQRKKAQWLLFQEYVLMD